MQLIRAGGTPFEIGHEIGRSVPNLVREAVETVCRFDIDRDELERRLRPVEARLAETFPSTLEEARGLAAGAGIDERDALLLSVASDVHGRLPGWCSLIAVPTGDGVLLGKNLDTTEEMGRLQIVEVLSPEGGLMFAHLTTAGAMWTDGGVNEAGLGLVNASLAAANVDPGGVPDGILAREVLARCSDVGEGIELLSAHGMMSLGENLLLADASGRVALVEKLPGGQVVHEQRRIAACNHVRAETLRALLDAGDPIRENSQRRLATLDQQTGPDADAWDRERVGALLAEHDGDVCQHGDSDLWTVASLMAAPREHRLWVADGPPCREAHQEVEWEVRRAPGAHSTKEVERHGT